MRHNRIIFHIDVNNAFLSWTAIKLLNSGYETDIRTIPSVISGDESKRHGIVLAKSPVAKQYGIVTAETLYSARKKCKNLKVFAPDYKYYKEISNKFFEYLKKLTPDIEKFSIDECFIDLTNMNYLYKDLLQLAYRIKHEIKDKYGFTVNVGIANNKLCAKMASDFEKPDKVHTLFEEEIEKKMYNLTVQKLFMIGKSTADKLNKLSIYTIGDLANANEKKLKSYFKNQTVKMIESANGIDDEKVYSNITENKCISISQTFENDTNNIDIIEETLKKQSEKISRELRKGNRYAYTIGVTIKKYNFEKKSKQITLKNPVCSTLDIYNIVKKEFYKLWDKQKIRNIGIKLNNLTNCEFLQQNLFNNETQNNCIDIIIDKINDKYNSNYIYYASNNK